jgi:hypothetical protein
MAVGRGGVRGSRAAKGMTYRMVAPTLLLLVFVTTAVLLYGDSFASVPVSLLSLSFFLSFFENFLISLVFIFFSRVSSLVASVWGRGPGLLTACVKKLDFPVEMT